MSDELTPIGPPKERVLQALGSKDCVAATCAMVVGITLAEAHEWAGTIPGEPWFDCMAVAFLLRHGFLMGYGIEFDKPQKIDPKANIISDGELDGQLCYVAVTGNSNCMACGGTGKWYETTTSGALPADAESGPCTHCHGTGHSAHAVYWDGKVIWDPHPEVSDALPLNDYEVWGFWPIYKLHPNQAARMQRLRMN